MPPTKNLQANNISCRNEAHHPFLREKSNVFNTKIIRQNLFAQRSKCFQEFLSYQEIVLYIQLKLTDKFVFLIINSMEYISVGIFAQYYVYSTVKDSYEYNNCPLLQICWRTRHERRNQEINIVINKYYYMFTFHFEMKKSLSFYPITTYWSFSCSDISKTYASVEKKHN